MLVSIRRVSKIVAFDLKEQHLYVPHLKNSFLDLRSALESTTALVFYWILCAKAYGCNSQQNCQDCAATLEGTHSAVHIDQQNYWDLTNWCPPCS